MKHQKCTSLNFLLAGLLLSITLVLPSAKLLAGGGFISFHLDTQYVFVEKVSDLAPTQFNLMDDIDSTIAINDGFYNGRKAPQCPIHHTAAPHLCDNQDYTTLWNPSLPKPTTENIATNIKGPEFGNVFFQQPIQLEGVVQVLLDENAFWNSIPSQAINLDDEDEQIRYTNETDQGNVLFESNQNRGLTNIAAMDRNIQILEPQARGNLTDIRGLTNIDASTQLTDAPTGNLLVRNVQVRTNLIPQVQMPVIAWSENPVLFNFNLPQPSQEIWVPVDLDEPTTPTEAEVESNQMDESSKQIEYATPSTMKIKAWPNPTAGQFRAAVNGTAGESVTYQIMTIDGKIIRNQTTDTETVAFDLLDQPAGTYIVKATSANGQSWATNLVLQH